MTNDTKSLPRSAMPIVAECGVFTTEHIPDWMYDWLDWTRRLVAPEANIFVRLQDVLNGNELIEGRCAARNQYLHAAVEFKRDLPDTFEGWVTVVHEVLHYLLNRQRTAAAAIAAIQTTSKDEDDIIACVSDGDYSNLTPAMMVAMEMYGQAEEETITKLSRIFVGMRIAQMQLEQDLAKAKSAKVKRVNK